MRADATKTGVEFATWNYVEWRVAAGKYTVAVAIVLEDTVETFALAERYAYFVLNDPSGEHFALWNTCYNWSAAAADEAPDCLGNTSSSANWNCTRWPLLHCGPANSALRGSRPTIAVAELTPLGEYVDKDEECREDEYGLSVDKNE